MISLFKKMVFAISIALYSSVLFADQFYASKGVAIEGYDTVAYFTQNTAVKGLHKYSTVWDGITWYFSNEKHLTLFTASPEKYIPQFGGYCALGAAHNGAVPSDPQTFTIHKEKLYFNMSPPVATTWRLNPDFHIERATKAWQNKEIVFY